MRLPLSHLGGIKKHFIYPERVLTILKKNAGGRDRTCVGTKPIDDLQRV